MTVTSSGKSSLWTFLRGLVDVEPHVLTDDDPPWHEPGKLYEVDEETYWNFLELLPPRWIHDDWFAFGEGTGPFRIYVKLHDAYCVRELTDDETRTFCELSGTPLHI